MILFSEIFSRAVNLFDDPDIRQNYIMNPAGFEMEMRPLLINGLNKFQYPTIVTNQLTEYSEADGSIETFEGDNTNKYKLSTLPLQNSVFSFKINDEFVNGEITLDEESNLIAVFPRVVTKNETCQVIWYYAGAFTADFTSLFARNIPDKSVMEKIKNILAHSILSAWGDIEMNRAIEFRNMFSDADLSFYSPANSARAKTEWHNQVNKDMDTLVNDLVWMIGSTPRGGSRFGK